MPVELYHQWKLSISYTTVLFIIKYTYGSKNTFLMSKGHGCMSQYIVLNELGILDDKHLKTYCKSNGILGCHLILVTQV